MIRSILAAIVALSLTSASYGTDTWIQRFTIEADDPSDYSAEEFYEALMGAFYTAGYSEWGPGDNPNGWESPDPDEITIEPGDLLPGPTDNGNCTDWYWEVPETRGCG
jgi:hypothetical protein